MLVVRGEKRKKKKKKCGEASGGTEIASGGVRRGFRGEETPSPSFELIKPKKVLYVGRKNT